MVDSRKQKSIRISNELATALENRKADNEALSTVAVKMIEKGMKVVNGNCFELDDTQKQPFFKHLVGGKGKEYQHDLMSLELTEQELVDMAILKSGKRYEDLLKEALITYSKEQITYAARREQIDRTSDGTPEKRLQEAFSELTDMMMCGRYKPRGGRLNISAVAQRARVNFNTAKLWAEDNQPELL